MQEASLDPDLEQKMRDLQHISRAMNLIFIQQGKTKEWYDMGELWMSGLKEVAEEHKKRTGIKLVFFGI